MKGDSSFFQVEIGGDTKYSRVGIYDSPDPESISTNTLSSRTVPNITSVSEYRYRVFRLVFLFDLRIFLKLEKFIVILVTHKI